MTVANLREARPLQSVLRDYDAVAKPPVQAGKRTIRYGCGSVLKQRLSYSMNFAYLSAGAIVSIALHIVTVIPFNRELSARP